MPSSPKNALRPLGIRVPKDVWESLDIIRLLEGQRSMQELLRPVIEEFVTQHEGSPELAEIRRNVQAYRRRKRPLRSVTDRDTT